MTVLGSTKKYPAFTLLEMLLVISILTTFGTLTASAFSGLQSAVRMDQETEDIGQDIRNLQRASILLERNSNEKWLYGLGIDFSKYEETGEYTYFKWCSQYDEYGNKQTRSEIPGYDEDNALSETNGFLPVPISSDTECTVGDGAISSKLIKYETGYTNLTDESLNPRLVSNRDIKYIVFEAVSGRAFFYDGQGTLVNYDTLGSLVASPSDFRIELKSKNATKVISVRNLSGKVSIEEEDDE
jgi:type II secretory pathway pseudopilin PulG